MTGSVGWASAWPGGLPLECPWTRRVPIRRSGETAALLALSTRTIHRYIAEGKLRAYRVAGEKVIRIKREDVEALLEPVDAEGQASGAGGKQP